MVAISSTCLRFFPIYCAKTLRKALDASGRPEGQVREGHRVGDAVETTTRTAPAVFVPESVKGPVFVSVSVNEAYIQPSPSEPSESSRMPFTVTPTGAAIAVTAVNVAATTAKSDPVRFIHRSVPSGLEVKRDKRREN